MYDPTTGHLCFSEALKYLKGSRPVARASWKGSAQLWCVFGELMLFIPNGDSHTALFWTPSSQDVLAEDWVAVINADTHPLGDLT